MSNENGMVHGASRAMVAPLEFSDEQRQMIRDTFANGASDAEFAVLMEIAKTRRLNPLLRQIHFVKRWNTELRREVWNAQAAIDGLRAVAQRTGLYAGQDEPEFIENPDGTLRLCRVRVYRTDWHGRPAVGTAYWNEYVQTYRDKQTGKTVVTPMWARMPHVMLAKVAESIALRKAFPEDLGGVYSDAEMAQADSDYDEPRRLPSPQPTRELPATTSAPVLDATPAPADKIPALHALGIESKPARKSEPPPESEALTVWRGEVAGITTDDAAVSLWIANRRALDAVAADARSILAQRVAELRACSLPDAKRWLAAEVQAEDQRRATPPTEPAPEPPSTPPRGRKSARHPVAANDATTAPVEGTSAPASASQALDTVDAPGARSADGADLSTRALRREHLTTKDHPRAVEASYAAHADLPHYFDDCTARMTALVAPDGTRLSVLTARKRLVDACNKSLTKPAQGATRRAA